MSLIKIKTVKATHPLPPKKKTKKRAKNFCIVKPALLALTTFLIITKYTDFITEHDQCITVSLLHIVIIFTHG